MEDSEVCSLPGGLTSMRKQIHTQEAATSHTVTQFQFQHRTEQEMSTSEVTLSSGSRQAVPSCQQLNVQESMVICSNNNLSSSYENHQNETVSEEEFPRYTTRELRDRFERTIEEAAAQKPIKIGRDISQSKWSSTLNQSNKLTSEVCKEFATETTHASTMDYEDFPPPPPEDLPPPPPDLLQLPSDSVNIPVSPPSHKPLEPVNKQAHNRESYFKQKGMSELKRLYKHIHPEVRKNIEKEFYSEYTETENNQVESQVYTYEEDDVSPDDVYDEEYEEWEEILPGEVQAMRWMFENKPLDAIKDEIPDDDEDNKKITKQEIIVGKDVRRTAWMFETKPIDELGSLNTNSMEYKNKFNKIDKGDVRAAAWLFETQTMDTLNKLHKEEDLTKEIVFSEEDGNASIYMIDSSLMESLGHTETIDERHMLSLRSVLEEINGEVKIITSTFDTQFKCVIMGQASQILEIKSVRKIETELENSIASRWLFDTQPLDLTKTEFVPFKLVCSLSMEDSSKGNWGRWLFEIKTLNSISDWNSLQMEKKDVIGAEVRKHRLVFETQPKDYSTDVRSESIEEIIGGNVRSARDFFESSPEVARKIGPEVGKLREVAIKEEMKGDVRHQKWRFESQPLEQIREEKKEVVRTVNVEDDLMHEDGTSCRADVRRNCWVFETQPMDKLKDDSNTCSLSKEEIIAGNVRSAREYFEMIPSEDLKDWVEVGKLKKTIQPNEEKGDVRHQKWLFESQPLEQIREEKKEVIRTIDLEEIDKVDVSNYKQIFESIDVNKSKESQMIEIEDVISGSVKSNKNLFESAALYAMQDSLGHFHEVKTVRREEIVKGDVKTYKWMFETQPVDQFNDSIEKYQIIKGISKHEVLSGDVKTAKWLFETQPLDAIKYFSNIEDEEAMETSKNFDVVKGDVKTCKWLFETKPMDILYEKVELKGENEFEEICKGDVKTCTWLFETQTLDSIHDETETVLKTRSINQENIRGQDVKMACFLFETENLESLSGNEKGSYKHVTEIDIASGDVSRKKYIFENQTSDIMTSSSEEVMQNLKRVQIEDIQKGNVVNCKWLFENQCIDQIHDSQEECMSSQTVNDVQRGDVSKGRFIFETYSLDKIHEASSETEKLETSKIVFDEEEKGDVRNYTMLFETQPLYAIQDREGNYHEVTTVTSEEVKKGNVVGTRWLFETKPLDAIKDTDEVYIIKSVTQQDVQKGDVRSAKWKFETQPLDRIAEEMKPLIKTVEDIQGGNVRVNKQRFETDSFPEGSIRTVNVSEIQRGDVRSAKWRFETQSIDKIRSMSSENLIETVKKEDVAKGDVKHSVWLFEKHPLDHIKEVEEDENISVIQEEIPKADVKTTTWLFETTPFDGFSESKVEKTEILGKSIKGTLEELYSQKIVSSKGILIEADEIGDVRMAKYQLMNKQTPEIQREEIIRGNLQTIMMNLLNREEKNKQQIVIESEEKGNISLTVEQLLNRETGSSIEKEDILHGDIQEAINQLLSESGSAKQGILIQEDEKGDVRMTLYSLLHKDQSINVEKEDVVKGDIKSALERLTSSDTTDQAIKIKIDDAERGNVSFFSTCIESGALDYLKQLQLGSGETLDEAAQKEKIIGGDIKNTKSILCQQQMQIERTVEDVIPGDVHNALKVFMSEPTVSLERIQKEEIVKGDLKAALSSLSESVNQTVVVEKEEVVKGNIPKALRCLERAQRRNKEVEKPDIIPGNIRGALRSLEKSSTSKVGAIVAEDLVPGNVKGTLKSLELAKQAVREVEKEEILRGDINMAMQSLQDASSERKICQQEIDVQGDVKGTIQLFMEPPVSQRTQHKFSLEDDVKGDVKLSIRSLYETQEQTQQEKEEVIKGDVKGTIKSLMETARRETPKVRHGAYRRVKVKQGPPVKNLKPDSQRNIQKIKTAKQVETFKENQVIANQSDNVEIKTSTVVEHKTITQNHGIKTVKTEFRNLKSNQKSMDKLAKTKVKTDNYFLKLQSEEPDLPLPPPPPPVTEAELLPPPPSPLPPAADTDSDHLPPPPPPLTGEQDFLPLPPPQQELEGIKVQAVPASPLTAKRMTVKKVKAPALHPVPKLEAKVELGKKKQVQTTSEKTAQKTQNEKEASMDFSKRVSHEVLPSPPETPKPLTKFHTVPVKFTPPPSPIPPADSPLPLKKVYIAPVKFTPPPSPPPFMRGKASKFNTPLIKAEEKYRKLKDENTPPTTPSPTLTHDSVSAAFEMLSSKDQAKHCVSGIIQEGSEITKAQAHSDSSVQVLVSDTAQSNVESQHEKVSTGSAVISSAKQQIITNETTKIVSSQQTTSILAVEQHLQTTTKKTVTVSSDQMAQSDQTDKVETAVRCVTGQGKKEIKTQKTKSSIKSEDQRKDETKTNQVLNNVSKDETKNKNLSSNKSQENVSDQQIEKTSTNAKGKVSKQNQKSKKNNNKQEAPVETSNCNESERCSVSKDFKVKQLEAAEIKPEIKEDIPIPALAATPQISNGNQLETQAPTKKKKKSKKSKGAAQQGQSKENVTESNTGTKRLANEMTQRAHETIAIGQIHKGTKVEHVEIKSEAITTGTKEDKKSLQQKAPQIQQKESQKKEVTAIQQSAKEQPKESRNVPITVTGKSEQNELVNLTEERIKGSQRHDVQVLISQITEIQSSSENTVSKSVKRLLNSTPDWIITPEMKQKLEQRAAESDAEKNEEILLNIRKLAESKLMDLADKTFEMRKCEGEKEGSVLVGQNISQISICSSKTEQQTFKSTSSEIRREERSLCKSIDLQAPSPSLRMRPPSPTFITIESMRRIDSPQRVTPSPTLLHRPPTPPTPPPRRCDTPTSRIMRITPSPTFDKAENLARLKETTAKLSRVVTPPPLLTHQITEKKSEVVEMPTAFQQQIKIDSQIMETSGQLIGSLNSNTNIAQTISENDVLQKEPNAAEDSDDSDLISASFKEKRDFFEGAQKAELNKISVHKEPITLTERLGPDMVDCEAENKNTEKDESLGSDLSSFVNKTESPEETLYNREELTPPAECLHSDTESSECDKEKAGILQQEMPSFNIQAIRNVFEIDKQNSSVTEERKDKEEMVSILSETRVDTSVLERPQETKEGSRQSTPLHFLKRNTETILAQPSALAETKTITEHFSDVDEFGNKLTGTVTAITQHSESISTSQVPFSYADAVKKKAARRAETYDEDATEKLLRNFHKTWTESETVFKNLGYTVCEESSSKAVLHQTTTVSLDSGSEVGALHDMLEEGLSDGCSDGGQKKVP
ncbi:PREDICTED: xin actin-binding repeat-containing protein 2 isoform X2 [Cyprinodon variegatus]|uniref:Xin actin binding repeat containing 2b n=1 Tax=Cyprinodon variegatus TaxID=28743 RepID=A0A3Q2DPG7_CYPVA|nr:PREDICTED: xin actin-binding repeat-containing protein 2 isoform X2 [Cyprinodon variegatus]